MGTRFAIKNGYSTSKYLYRLPPNSQTTTLSDDSPLKPGDVRMYVNAPSVQYWLADSADAPMPANVVTVSNRVADNDEFAVPPALPVNMFVLGPDDNTQTIVPRSSSGSHSWLTWFMVLLLLGGGAALVYWLVTRSN